MAAIAVELADALHFEDAIQPHHVPFLVAALQANVSLASPPSPDRGLDSFDACNPLALEICVVTVLLLLAARLKQHAA